VTCFPSPGAATTRCCALLRPRATTSEREEAGRLRDRIEELCREFPRYGYRRVPAQLRREEFVVNQKRVQRIMAEERRLCQGKRRFLRTTDSNHGFRRFPHLTRGLAVTRRNQVWIADWTYLRLREQCVSLAVLLDSYSRRGIGWELSSDRSAAFCLRARRQALQALQALQGRKPAPEFIPHSDQGV
jgi:putative transposase